MATSAQNRPMPRLTLPVVLARRRVVSLVPDRQTTDKSAGDHNFHSSVLLPTRRRGIGDQRPRVAEVLAVNLIR